MIPISSSNYQQGCDPVSSNCVVWQGPDISCINLCKGDSISDVVAKLATELCEIQNSFDISGINLSCLELTTAPTNSEELFQVLVDEICSLGSRCDSLESGSGSGSTSEIVATLPTCLQYTNAQNDLVTQLPIDEYAELVAAKVCEIVADITIINTQISDHETRITNLENNTGSDYTTPQITPSCVLPSVPTDIDVVLDELEDQFCTLDNVLGGSTSLLASTTYQCDLLSTDDQLGGSGTMSSLEGWVTPVTSVADSLTNMWLTICDMRAAIKDIQTNCCTGATCNDVIFSAFGSYANDTITLNFGGSVIPSGFSECNVAGNSVIITDAASNSYSATVSVIDALAGNDTETIDISGSQLSDVSNYFVTITLCVTDGDITCEKVLSFEVVNDASSCDVPTGISVTLE
jgi:hypothetical protein